jgi:hypothetical protein
MQNHQTMLNVKGNVNMNTKDIEDTAWADPLEDFDQGYGNLQFKPFFPENKGMFCMISSTFNNNRLQSTANFFNEYAFIWGFRDSPMYYFGAPAD